MNNKIYPLLAVSVAVLFSACGGGTNSEKTKALVLTAPQNRMLSGVAQKGPAVKGGLVHLYELDAYAHRTGRSLISLIQDNKGEFSSVVPDDWGQFVEVVFNGRYISEVTGELSAPIQLRAIQDSNLSKQVSVNILTTLATARVKSLPRNTVNYSLAATLRTAYLSLEKIIGIPAKEIPYINLFGGESRKARASMLLLSGALLEVAANKGASVQRVIDQLAIDFALDGVFDGRGDEWLRGMQALIHNIEGGYVAKYSRALKRVYVGSERLPQEEDLSKVVVFSTRPTAVTTIVEIKSICAGDVTLLSGEGSKDSDNGNNIRYSWFQTDQTGLLVSLNSRFTKDASFVAPSITQATTLFFTLLVVDERRDEQGNVLDITDVSTVEVVVQPKESELCRDEPIVEEVIEEVAPIIFIPLPPPPSVPIATDVFISIEKGGTINDYDLKDNVSGPLNQVLEYSIINDPPNGVASINALGILSYTHDDGFTTEDALEYKIQDQSSPPRVATAIVRFNITSLEVNTAPVMVMQSEGGNTPLDNSLVLTFDENAVGTVFDINSIDDTDSEGSGLVYSFAGGEDDGLFSLDSSSGILAFKTPPDYENGEDSEYKTKVTVTDSGSLSDTVDIFVEVNDINEAPVAVNDSVLPSSLDFVSPGSAEPTGLLKVTRNVLNNDNSLDASDMHAVSLVSGSLNQGQISGTLILNPNGSFTYTAPLPVPSGNITFMYEVTDGTSSSQALVTIINDGQI